MNLSTQKLLANPNSTDSFKSFALCNTAQEQGASLGLLVPSKIPNGKVLSICGNTYTVTGGVGVCSGGQTTGNLVILPWFPCTIGSSAFYGCSGLTGSLTLPNTVTLIRSLAFYGCTGFAGSLVLPNSLTSIGSQAFYGCTGFAGSLVLPNSLTTIGNNAFTSCTSLISVTIPSSVTSIGNSVFFLCDALTSVTIPSSVTSIGNYAFFNCSTLTTVNCRMTRTVFNATVGVNNMFFGTSASLVLHALPSTGWTAGTGLTIGGNTSVDVVLDLT
jgi:hypothetical protein